MGYLDETYGLRGRTAVVTGARSGIGRASALALAGAGADVVLWGRAPTGMDDVAGEVRALGVRARVVTADLGDSAAHLASTNHRHAVDGVSFHAHSRNNRAMGPQDPW